MKTIALIAQKGGAGKTTLALSIAIAGAHLFVGPLAEADNRRPC